MSHGRAASALALAASLSIAPGIADAAHSSAQFSVTVNLQPSEISVPSGHTPGHGPTTSGSAFCRSSDLPGAFGATVTVVCSTGTVVDIAPSHPGAPLSPMHGGAYRYITQLSVGGQIWGTVDLYSGLGTITSWRVVNLVDRRYVEMTLNW